MPGPILRIVILIAKLYQMICTAQGSSKPEKLWKQKEEVTYTAYSLGIPSRTPNFSTNKRTINHPRHLLISRSRISLSLTSTLKDHASKVLTDLLDKHSFAFTTPNAEILIIQSRFTIRSPLHLGPQILYTPRVTNLN